MAFDGDLLSDAWRRQRDGQSFEAAALCHELLGAEPAHAGACHLLGVIALGLGKPAAAVTWIGKAIAANAAIADYHADIGAAQLALQQFDAAAASYRRAASLAPQRGDCHLGLGKALRGQGQLTAAAAALATACALLPDHADVAFARGTVIAALGDTPAALDCFRTAVALRPDFADAHTNLGLMLFAAGDVGAAERTYRRALAIAPDNAAALNNLGNACARQDRFAEAIACFEHAIAGDPAYVAPRVNLGNLLLERGDPAAAIACYDSALALAPDLAEAYQNRGLVELMLGDFAAGWRDWRWPAPVRRRFDAPEWRGEALAGATILLHAEQGFGDTLHFVRYVALVAARGGRVILEVPAELCRLLGTVAGADQVVAVGALLPDFAWHCSLLSRPLAFATTAETIPTRVPYVTPPAPMALPVALPTGGDWVRVGLVWAGRPEHNRDRHRSLPLAALAPLFKVPGAAFYSLQKGPAAAQIVRTGLALTDLAPLLDDFTDAAAAIMALDLVVTVDTAIAHLAGALGRPVWLLLSGVPDWRWLLGRDDSPWYPTARLFRQQRPGDWTAPVAGVAAALARWPA